MFTFNNSVFKSVKLCLNVVVLCYVFESINIVLSLINMFKCILCSC